MRGKQNKLIKKPWVLATNDRRLVEMFAEMQCNHTPDMHEPCEGGNAATTAYYSLPFVNLVAEALYPRWSYSMKVSALNSPCKQEETVFNTETLEVEVFVLVTKALSRSEWINNPLALDAIAKECGGLRDNCTWDDSTACDLDIRQENSNRTSRLLSLWSCVVSNTLNCTSPSTATKGESYIEATRCAPNMETLFCAQKYPPLPQQ